MSGRGKPAGRKRKAQTKLPENKETIVKKTPLKTYVLTKFHENWAKNKTAPPPGGNVFPPIMTIFKLVRDIYKIDTQNVTSTENDPLPLAAMFFYRSKLFSNSTVISRNVLTKLQEYWTKNVTSRRKLPPPPGGHVFSPVWTIFELVRT
ncbi:hypothetical protein DPMN_011459 [Dreissena polymorpha]|uniref:Uncharacterized protein n=1 Tax=Dreissena polymorpha TaxID=45954 RepID=A0A9D4N665_DREPO|nr:hypothetical protein DPMN_011459 [Dreissena polymorpha]